MHFINVARLYNLLSEKDAEPMQPLVDLWVKQGVLPKVEKPESGSVDLTSSQTAGNAAPTAQASVTA